MGYLDDAEDIFRDMDAIKNHQKYQEALKVQAQRNKSDKSKIWNYDFVVAERDALLNERKNGAERAVGILSTIFKALEDNGLDSEGEVVPKDPVEAGVFTLKRIVIGLIKAQVNVHYKNEFKVELENKFKQEYQKQTDQIIENARTKSSGMPEEKERAMKNLIQKIKDSYPHDVFSSLEGSCPIWCDGCQGTHLHFFIPDDVTTLLRHSSVKMDTKNQTSYYGSLRTPFLTWNPHVQEIHLATVVRVYLASRLREEQKKG